MTRARSVLITLLLVALGLYVVRGVNTTYEYNYRFDVIFSTPTGPLKAGRVSKIRISYPLFNYFFAQSFADVELFSEAITAEVGGGKGVVVTLWDDPARLGSLGGTALAEEELRISRVKTALAGEIERARQLGRVAVPIERLPMLVSFEAPDDPQTMKKLDPSNLRAALGGDYALQEASIVLVDEPVSPPEIETRFPWLKSLVGKPETSNQLPFSLVRSSFKMEGKR